MTADQFMAFSQKDCRNSLARQPALLFVPECGLGNPAFVAAAWRIAQYIAQFGVAELAVFGIEGHPAAVDGRLDAERRADRLAEVSGQKERPDGQADDSYLFAQGLRREPPDVNDGHRPVIGGDEDLGKGLVRDCCCQEYLRQVVKMDEMVDALAAAEHQDKAFVGHFEYLEQSAVARAEDARWPDDRVRDAVLAGKFTQPQLAFHLGALVAVARTEAVFFIRDVVAGDVAMHADGRGVNKPLEVRPALDRLSQELGGADMHLPVILLGRLFLAEGGGEMEDVCNPFRGFSDSFRVKDLAPEPGDVEAAQIAKIGRSAGNGVDPRPGGGQLLGQQPAGETGGSGDQDAGVVKLLMHWGCHVFFLSTLHRFSCLRIAEL